MENSWTVEIRPLDLGFLARITMQHGFAGETHERAAGGEEDVEGGADPARTSLDLGAATARRREKAAVAARRSSSKE